MEFLSLSRRRSSARNVPSGEERGETDVSAGYHLCRLPATDSPRVWRDTIYYVNTGLRHQYGISAAESQTFLRAKRPQRRRARRNGCFRRLIPVHTTLKCGTEPLRYVIGAAHLRSVLVRKLKPYLVWVSCRRKSLPVQCQQPQKDQYPGVGGGEGLSSSSYRPMGMYRWMGSRFYCLIDYYGVAVSIELLEWDRTFSGFGVSENSGS